MGPCPPGLLAAGNDASPAEPGPAGLEKPHSAPFPRYARQGLVRLFRAHGPGDDQGGRPAVALHLYGLDLRPILPEIRQPVLLVVGKRDPVIGQNHENDLMSGLPNAGKVILEGCGHLPAYTHPDMLAGVVRRFLTPPDNVAASLPTCRLDGRVEKIAATVPSPFCSTPDTSQP